MKCMCNLKTAMILILAVLLFSMMAKQTGLMGGCMGGQTIGYMTECGCAD